jgi:capsular polysaccharide biosynthesis protein
MESLEVCGIQSVLSQIDVGSNYMTVLTIPELYVLCNLSVCRAYELLRNALRSEVDERSHEITQPARKIYLERGTIRGMNRLVNEPEIIEFLKKKNFEIVRPHELNLRKKALHFDQFDLFVCPPASAYFNFYFFSHTNAHLIYCIHETALYNETTAVLGGSIYQCHDLYRTTLLPASQPTVTDKNWPQYDAECYVDIEQLGRTIETLAS